MLLSTKFTAPEISAFIVPRPRLFSQLHEARTGKVTLVTAPAGYGKTTLVASWLAALADTAGEATWLLLDEYDDDPARFMRYLIGALQQLVPDVGMTIQEMLESNHATPLPQSIEEMFTTLINELAEMATPLLLVLDDLHLVTDKQIVNGLRFWIEHAPANIHTILTSRDASMLPIARWKVRRQCVEVAMVDLCFTPEEAGTFVRGVLRLDLTDEEILQLLQRTEGWIAGLQLAAMSLQSADDPKALLRNFTGSDRHVTDYLIEEVLEKQPADLCNFLLQTSILKRLSPSLCDAVLASSDSYQVLEQLEKQNLFLIPLDNQRQWYRYHPLFAEALQTRLQYLQGDHIAEYHQRAMVWLMDNGEPEEAIEHALAGQSYPEAAALIFERCYNILWQQGRPRVFLRWCKQLPDEALFAIPRLVIAVGWAYLLVGRYKSLQRWIDKMQAVWSPINFDFVDGTKIRNEVALLQAEIAVNYGEISRVIQILDGIDAGTATLHPTTEAMAQQLYGYAHRLNGDVAAAKRYLRNAVRLSEQHDDKSMWIFSHFDLAETHVMAGEFPEALALYQKILDRYPAKRYPNYSSLVYIYTRLAHILYLQNRLQDATDYVQRSLTTSVTPSWIARLSRMILADIQYVQGKWSAVEASIQAIQRTMNGRQSKGTQITVDAFIVKLYLLHGDLEQAAAWATTYPQQQDAAIPRYQLHRTEVTLARYQVAVDPPIAISTLNQLQKTAQQEQWHESWLEIEILRTLAYQSLGQLEKALVALDCALDLAEPAQIITPFLLGGPPMVSLLRKALESSHHRAFIGQIQAAFLPTTDVVTQPLVEPLTKRELEVLQMMADGLSNPEIAAKMIIATGTVAKYSNNIFTKLNVRNRTQATQRARVLKLLVSHDESQ